MTIKNLLKKLIQYVIHLGRPKTTKLQKTITIDLKPSKSKKKTPSLNKIQSTSSDVQIKQVERQQQIWWFIVLGVLLLSVAEMWLANRY